MANTYTQLLYHVVFSTKHRARVLTANRREDLFRYAWGIHKNLGCHLYRINGVEDHIHILTSLHRMLCLSDYVREVKTGCTRWIKAGQVFPDFEGWQDGYGAFTLSTREKDGVINYIKNQQEHHRQESFADEYKRLLSMEGISFDERYLL